MTKAAWLYLLVTEVLVLSGILVCWTNHNIETERKVAAASITFWQKEYHEQVAITQSILKGKGK